MEQARPPSLRRALPPPEENPWRNASYAATTLQLMATLLDLFVDSGDLPAMHYTITTLQFVPALYLAAYQIARIVCLRKSMEGASWCRKPFLLLALALLLQLYVVVACAMWYEISFDVNSHNMEWSVFAVVLVYSLVNPATYAAVEESVASAEEGAGKKARMGPGTAAVTVFRKHFMQEKLLFVLGALAACGQAILSTYQGAVINELTKMVTKKTIDPETLELKIGATLSEVEVQAGILICVWAAANLSRFIFDLLSALMFSRLEIWLRGAVFEKGMAHAGDETFADPAAEFGARYASDIQGVISLYGTLLRGVIVNMILIVTSFAFLAVYNWEVAVATLGFLAMAVTSGPSELAGNATKSAQKRATEGLGMLSEGVRQTSGADDESALCLQHKEKVLDPMRKDLFAQAFYSNSVATYINFFSSFLTVIVVITMSFNVYEGVMESSDFLGVFFVFKQLQKPAMKMSGVLKSLIKKSANLERLNDTIFEASGSATQEASDAADDGRDDATSENDEDDRA